MTQYKLANIYFFLQNSDDDDFMISEEEIDLDIAFSGNEQEEKDGDSDFILDDNDEGSDWETKNRRSSKGNQSKYVWILIWLDCRYHSAMLKTFHDFSMETHNFSLSNLSDR